MAHPDELTATRAVALMAEGRLSVDDMAQACLVRDPVVKGLGFCFVAGFGRGSDRIPG